MSISAWWSMLWQVIGRVLLLDPAVFQEMRAAALGPQVAWGILLLAGLSLTIGQSVTLFANRVSRERFVRALLLSASIFALSAALWAGSIWLIARLLFDLSSPFRHVLISVGLSYAPLLFGLFIFMPYLGNVLNHVLRIWVLLVSIAAITSSANLRIGQALICVVLGWLVWQGLSSYVGKPIGRAIDALERRLLGTELHNSLDLSSEIARERARLQAVANVDAETGSRQETRDRK